MWKNGLLMNSYGDGEGRFFEEVFVGRKSRFWFVTYNIGSNLEVKARNF